LAWLELTVTSLCGRRRSKFERRSAKGHISQGEGLEVDVHARLKHLEPGIAARIRRTARKEAKLMPLGHERTKEQLYSQAKRLGVKGRSKMNKGQLKAALARRGH
jgi:hypothetical protein